MQVGPQTCLSARLAIYVDGEPEPKVEEVQGTGPEELIHRLSTAVDRVVTELGGAIPKPASRALIENLVHADFRSVSVSILDGGRTLRVADQGCGIKDKQRALEPGFSTADDRAREIISGVGAGLSVASRLIADAGGRLDLSDNLGTGTVVTLALPAQPAQPAIQAGRVSELTASLGEPGVELSDSGKRILLLLAELGGAAVPTICNELRLNMAEVQAELDALRRQQLLDPRAGRQMVLTSTGLTYLDGIFVE